MDSDKAEIIKNNKIVDIKFLRGVTGNDREFELELFDLFLDSGKANLLKMERSIEDESEDAWYVASHSIKGAASSLGIPELARIMEFAQNHPKETIQKKRFILDKATAEFEKTAKFIKEYLY